MLQNKIKHKALIIDCESTFIFSISWHPSEIWEKKMQKLMLHRNFVKVICASCKTKFKTIIIYEISWHLAEKIEISSFYTEKCIQIFFCQILCSGRVAQWSTHWPSDLKVPGSTPPWGKHFFLLFYNFFCKIRLFLYHMSNKVICEIPFELKLIRMLNIFTLCLNINILSLIHIWRCRRRG